MFERKDMLMVETLSHPHNLGNKIEHYVANFQDVNLQFWFDVDYATYNPEDGTVEFEFTISRGDTIIREALEMMLGKDGRGWWHAYSIADGMETCSHEKISDACMEYAILYMLRFFK